VPSRRMIARIKGIFKTLIGYDANLVIKFQCFHCASGITSVYLMGINHQTP
jgi:hypothetical protein